MPNPHPRNLSRRERQIMDVVYRTGRATASEVQGGMPEPPSYSAVRAHLRTLEEKGHLRHVEEGGRYVYLPTVSRNKVRKQAVRHLLDTFFDGSVEDAVAALIDGGDLELTERERKGLLDRIETARRKGR